MMSKSLKLLACALYVVFTTAACHPNVQTHDSDAPAQKAYQKGKVVSAGDIPNTAYRLVEYKVMYDTNRVVHCLGLKSQYEHVKQTSLTCDWERSRWDGIH
jgi:hypothetical protein